MVADWGVGLLSVTVRVRVRVRGVLVFEA